VVLLVLTLAGVSLVSDLSQLGGLARTFDRRLLLPIFLLAPANYVFRYYKWTILLRRAGLRVPPGPSLTIFLAGLSMTVTPAKAGELIKTHYLKETLGVPYAVSAPVVIAERVLDSASVLILALAGTAAGIGAVAGRTGVDYATYVVAASAIGLALAVLLLRSRRGLEWFAGVVRHVPGVGQSLAEFVEAFGAGSRQLLDPRTFAWCTLVGILSWSLEGLVVYLTLAGLGQASPPLLGVFVVALASLAGAVSLLPGGIGAAEATIFGLLVLYGFPRAVAGATTIVTRAATLWLGVAIGVVALALAEREVGRRRGRISRGESEPDQKTWDFDRSAAGYDSWVAGDSGLYARYGEVLERVVTVAGVAAGKRVLDIGTGTGNLALTCLGRGATVVGVDPSERMLSLAREKAHRLKPAHRERATFLQAADPFVNVAHPDASFDAVVSSYAFHHVPRRHQPGAVREMVRVLRPGGVWANGDLAFADTEAETRALGTYQWLEAEYFPLLEKLAPVFASLGLTLRAEQFTPVTWVLWAVKP
jgi:uncharacterized protein (TIRG00374 family)